MRQSVAVRDMGLCRFDTCHAWLVKRWVAQGRNSRCLGKRRAAAVDSRWTQGIRYYRWSCGECWPPLRPLQVPLGHNREVR